MLTAPQKAENNDEPYLFVNLRGEILGYNKAYEKEFEGDISE